MLQLFGYTSIKGKEDEVAKYFVHPTIGGWIIMPIIGLFLTPPIAIFQIVKNGFLNSSTFYAITSQASAAYDSLFGVYWILVLFFQAAFIVLPIFLLIMIFQYDRRVRIFMISFYVLNIMAKLILLIVGTHITFLDANARWALIKDLIMALGAGAIWISYFHYSFRVRETFMK